MNTAAFNWPWSRAARVESESESESGSEWTASATSQTANPPRAAVQRAAAGRPESGQVAATHQVISCYLSANSLAVGTAQ